VNGNLVNFAAFQVCWFCNVLGAAAGAPWIGPMVTGAWILVHLLSMGDTRASEWPVLLVAALLGYCVDSALVLGDMISFPLPTQLGWPSPIWMVALWAGFAATLSRSLGWLRGRYALAGLLGAVGGPLAYYAGQKLGAIELTSGSQSLAWIGIEWAVAVPLLVALNGLFTRRRAVGSMASLPQEQTR
jgi:hypothetical protein